MGTVYLARVRGAGGFEREVALKLMHPHLRRESSFSRDLIEEAKIAVKIRHPNVVSIIDVGDDPFGLFLVMEYVEGDTLGGLHSRVFSESAEFPPGVGIRILLDAIAGLHAAHELCDEGGNPAGIIHRDFSPQNILVGIDGVGRLADFGIAKAASRLDHTQTGVIKGKVSYMAPEQAKGKPIDRRVDVWAAGVVAWQLLAGRRIHDSENELATLLKVATVTPPLLHEVGVNIAPEIEQVIARALTLDPAARWPTAKAFRQALTEAWRATGPLPEPEEVGECVQRLVGRKLAERRARVAEVERLRANVDRLASSDDLELTPEEDGLPPSVSELSVDLLREPVPPRQEGEAPTSEYVPDGRHEVVEAVPVVELSTTTGTPVVGPIEPEPTRTDTTSVSNAKVLTPFAPTWMTRRVILAGALAPVAFAVLLAFWFSRSRPGPEIDPVATASTEAEPAEQSATAAGGTEAAGTAPLGYLGEPPKPPGARPQQLAVHSNAAILTLRVGARTVDLPRPGRDVAIDLTADEAAHTAHVDAVSADGRRAQASVAPGESSVQLSFASVAPAQHATPHPPPPKAAASAPAGPPPLAPIPYGQGK